MRLSNFATLLMLFVTEVYSLLISFAPEISCTSSHEISFLIGPEWPPTLIGNVLMTRTTSSMCLGPMPTSDANPDAVVSLDVRNGY